MSKDGLCAIVTGSASGLGAATAAILSPSRDAVLVGEHQNKPDFPPTLMGRLLLDAVLSADAA